MRPRKYGDRTLQEILDLWKSGYPVQELAEMFNYHPNDHSRLMHDGIRRGLFPREDYQYWVGKKKSEGGKFSPKYQMLISQYRNENIGGLPEYKNAIVGHPVTYKSNLPLEGGFTPEDMKIYHIHSQKYT